jgi:hypothetical protein
MGIGGGLAMFRAAWVSGHLDHLRAVDALESARNAADAAAAGEATARAAAEVAKAQRRLGEVEATLVAQFDRFCGIRESARSPG